MRFSKSTFLHCLLITVTLKSFIYMIITPLWHGPDEQAHFAQVQYFAEFGHPIPNDINVKDLSAEIFASEQLLGTARNYQGRNKYTFHPEYRLEYTPTIIGKYETIINNFPSDDRVTFAKNEATRYPPLFYYISAVFYWLAYPAGLIARVMTVRITSIMMGTLLVYFGYKTAEIIFPNNYLAVMTSSLMIAFQPMFSFLTATVNSDNLMNLLFTMLFYYCVKIISSEKLGIWGPISIGLITVAGFLTKPHFAVAIPILLTVPLFIISKLRHAIKHAPKITILAVISLLSLMLVRLWGIIGRLLKGQMPILPEVSIRFILKPNSPVSLLTHLNWTAHHTFAEVIPWYWGVFNWLGVTLPHLANQIINRVLIIGVLGVFIWLVKHYHPKKWGASQKCLLFLSLSNGIYFFILLLWDWIFVRQNGFSFGMQGRYYFPLLTTHMLWLYVGCITLIPKKWEKIKSLAAKFLGLGMIGLHGVGLYTLASTYYHLSTLQTFFIEISQYKPAPLKYPWMIGWVTLYGISLAILVNLYIRYATRTRSRV